MNAQLSQEGLEFFATNPHFMKALAEGKLEWSFSAYKDKWHSVNTIAYDTNYSPKYIKWRVRREPLKVIFAEREGRCEVIDPSSIGTFVARGWTIYDGVERV